jgi:hypothetical protein
VKIFGSRLLITIRIRVSFANIWIAIINRDPNQGCIYNYPDLLGGHL